MSPSSRGSLVVVGQDLQALVLSLNTALQQIRDELDELHGLRAASSFYGQKTFKGVAVRVVDADGTLVHAFGAST